MSFLKLVALHWRQKNTLCELVFSYTMMSFRIEINETAFLSLLDYRQCRLGIQKLQKGQF